MRKSVIFAILTTIVISIAGASKPNNVNSTRDLKYEEFCDSIWANDPDYYLDVLVETDEFQDYIETNGEWWD